MNTHTFKAAAAALVAAALVAIGTASPTCVRFVCELGVAECHCLCQPIKR
jgi:hypothetical protein